MRINTYHRAGMGLIQDERGIGVAFTRIGGQNGLSRGSFFFPQVVPLRGTGEMTGTPNKYQQYGQGKCKRCNNYAIYAIHAKSPLRRSFTPWVTIN
jgi:hypothetical protein